jgi:hypothetical protein
MNSVKEGVALVGGILRICVVIAKELIKNKKKRTKKASSSKELGI